LTPFDCGCTPDGTDRCALHLGWLCHRPNTDAAMVLEWKISVGVCPPCRIAKWRSVSLSAEATPTRGKR
jgi:hypothetical protein